MEKDEAEACGLYNVIGYDMDEAYIKALKKMSINGDIIRQVADDIKIVYTPFHGTGNVSVRRILKELGFKHVYIVKEQEKPDPDFTTLEYPNPEDPKAFTLALKLAKEKDADIILATDPDADRLGVYSKDTKTGEYKAFTGNMSGMLIAEYLLSQRKEKNLLHDNGAFVKTIVSTNMADAIAAEKGIKVQHGIYIGTQGPTFETPAEYKLFHILGADAVGMSTVPEVIVANHCGIKVFGISVVTDLGVEGKIVEVSHEEVQKAADAAQPKMTTIMRELINRA